MQMKKLKPNTQIMEEVRDLERKVERKFTKER